MPEKIEHFINEYRFLSNFEMCIIDYQGYIYPSVEHAFQAAKTLDSKEDEKIRKARTPGDAKRLGQKVTLRSDWEESKFGIMFMLVLEKFSFHDELRQQLLDTGDAELIEGNHWKDKYWGVCGGEGYNYLGIILMTVRGILRNEESIIEIQEGED